ncbi:VTT domain-containing protein [Variovorax sp. N23]|uniref:VTT domain-containing protein n=1 Tax=Variovorax sp. N23 TaxID=2980555 RepID=UPI0021C7EBF2|nr:VTT domain-containing protein [Variovorax sp. N23]MCU4119447.1 VTT domain-containing protein [Variovorax sp. N23]
MQELLSLATERGVAVVFFATLAARLGAPIPASAVLVVAGGLAAMGQISLWSTVLGALLGNLLGDAAWFYAGRRFGHRMMRLLCKVSLSPDTCVRQSESLITRWGGASLIAAKFVPGVSVVAPPMAGALHMSTARFVGFDTLAAAIWSAAFLVPGWIFSTQIQAVLDAMADAGAAALLVLLVAVAAGIGLRYWRRRAMLLAIDIPRVTVDELHALMASEAPPVVIDVRSPAGAELEPRRIPGALVLHLQDMKKNRGIPELPHDRHVVLYCNCPNEVTAAMAARLLAAQGVTQARPLAGGLDAWLASGHPTEIG